MTLSSNLQAVLFIAGMSAIVAGGLLYAAIRFGLIMADPEPPTTNSEGIEQ